MRYGNSLDDESWLAVGCKTVETTDTKQLLRTDSKSNNVKSVMTRSFEVQLLSLATGRILETLPVTSRVYSLTFALFSSGLFVGLADGNAFYFGSAIEIASDLNTSKVKQSLPTISTSASIHSPAPVSNSRNINVTRVKQIFDSSTENIPAVSHLFNSFIKLVQSDGHDIRKKLNSMSATSTNSLINKRNLETKTYVIDKHSTDVLVTSSNSKTIYSGKFAFCYFYLIDLRIIHRGKASIVRFENGRYTNS